MARAKRSADLTGKIDAILDDPSTKHLVEIYFEDRQFAGIDFDSLGSSSPHRFEAVDLLSLNLLDVQLRPNSIREVLSGRFDMLLSSIPVDLDLWDDEAAEGGPVWTRLTDLYQQIRELPHTGRTKTSKLLARKRPRLVPIRDSVIEKELGLGEEFWSPLRVALLDHGRRKRIDALAPTVNVSTLRRLDIAVWMHGSGSGSAKEARAEARRRVG